MGRPKAMLPLPGGQLLVEYVAGVVMEAGRWLDDVVLLGSSKSLPDSLADLPVLADAEPGAGPLAGLASLLQFAGKRWSLLVACDLPLLELRLLERLHAALRQDRDAVAFRRTDQSTAWHACCAFYHPRLLPDVRCELGKGNRSLQNLLAKARAIALHPTPDEERMLLNLNLPDDYDRLLRSD